MGGMFAVISLIPGADINIGGSSDPQAALITGLSILCGGLLFVAIPVGIGFFTLRKKSGGDEEIGETTPKGRKCWESWNPSRWVQTRPYLICSIISAAIS
jgi:hypothetical protein